MPSDKSKIISVIDKAIVFFFLLFLLSLTNSIFFNQLGYYGALLLVIAKGILQKENPFTRTGLEFAFLWFIGSELISMILADKNAEAMHFMLKRVLLLPIVYTAVAASFDLKLAKLYIKIYLAASLVTVVIYLYFSAQYFIYGLYSRTESGPSVFQYPITVSEITSFTVIILFAFIMHERLALKNRILLFIAFALSVLALISTFKRTGWMGAVFGIFIILVIKKQWTILAPAVLVFSAAVALDGNKSQVIEFNYDKGKLVRNVVAETKGRAYDINKIDSMLYISDHENGLHPVSQILVAKNPDLLLERMPVNLPAPVISLKKWNDSVYVANLIDTRFVLLNIAGEEIKTGNEFISPGLTNAYKIANGVLFVNDKDSGITVFNNPANLSDTVRLKYNLEFSGISADSNYLLAYKSDKGAFLFDMVNKKPSLVYKQIPYDGSLSFAELLNEKIILSGDKGTSIYKTTPAGPVLIQTSDKIKNIFRIVSDKKTFAVTHQREVFELDSLLNNINIISKNTIDFTPLSAAIKGDNLYFTLVKRNRVLSVFDKYMPSNFTRVALWTAGIRLFRDNPVFGVGDVDIADYYRQYKHPYDKEVQGHFHNNFIHILATLGLFGFAAVMFLFFKYIRISYRNFKERINVPFVGSYSLGVIGVFCAFLVSGLTELNFWDHEIATLLWFLFGLNAAFFNLTSDKNN